MGRPRFLGRLGTMSTALAGVVIGHLASYLLAIGDAQLRHELLAHTGHGYWATALATASVLGLGAAAAAALRHLRRASHPAEESVARFAFRLGLIQAAFFAALEVTERVVSGAPLGGLLDHRLIFVGLTVQLLVALSVALGLRALSTAARIVARAMRRPRLRLTVLAWPLPNSVSLPRVPSLARAWAARGPPAG